MENQSKYQNLIDNSPQLIIHQHEQKTSQVRWKFNPFPLLHAMTQPHKHVLWTYLYIVVWIKRKAVINSSRQDNHSPFLHPDTDPSIIVVPHIKITFTTVPNVSELQLVGWKYKVNSYINYSYHFQPSSSGSLHLYEDVLQKSFWFSPHNLAASLGKPQWSPEDEI